MFTERRKFIRFDVPLEVQYKLSSKESEYSSGMTVNFSREGFCLETKGHELQSGGISEMQIKLPKTDTYVQVTGNVVWKQRLEDGFLAGIRLVDMNTSAKSEILDYAYDLWLENTREPYS